MRKQFRLFCLSLSGILLLAAGCGKKEAPIASNPAPDTNLVQSATNAAPGPMATPVTPKVIPASDNMDAVLAQLTRELHRTMIGRKLSGSFDEFVAVSHVQPPPPPAGKKYAIDKHWHVVLVNN